MENEKIMEELIEIHNSDEEHVIDSDIIETANIDSSNITNVDTEKASLDKEFCSESSSKVKEVPLGKI